MHDLTNDRNLPIRKYRVFLMSNSQVEFFCVLNLSRQVLASYLSSFVVFFLPQYVPLNSLLCFFYHLLYINYSWPVLFMLCAFITISFLISLKWHLHQRHPCITAPDLGISLDSSCKYCHALSSPANLLFYSSTLVNKPLLNPGQNTGVILDLAFLHCSHQVVH